jgi:anti-anti-sigma factor
MSITVSVSDTDTVVTVTGEVDVAVSDSLGKQLATALATGPTALIADLSEVPFCDSSGLTVLLGTHNQAKAAGIPFVLVTGQRGLLRPISLLGLDTLLTIQPSLEAARAALAGGAKS